MKDRKTRRKNSTSSIWAHWGDLNIVITTVCKLITWDLLLVSLPWILLTKRSISSSSAQVINNTYSRQKCCLESISRIQFAYSTGEFSWLVRLDCRSLFIICDAVAVVVLRSCPITWDKMCLLWKFFVEISGYIYKEIWI